MARGARGAGPASDGAYVDALAALVDAEKERLKAGLLAAPGADAEASRDADVAGALAALRFEVAELRGRIESLQASVDALSARAGGDRVSGA